MAFTYSTLRTELSNGVLWATIDNPPINLIDERFVVDTDARRVFDRVASLDGGVSDTAVPPWRMATFRSMLYARLGLPGPGREAQEEADRTRPAGLPRFATHIELHRGLTMAKAGDRAGGVAYARRAWRRYRLSGGHRVSR